MNTGTEELKHRVDDYEHRSQLLSESVEELSYIRMPLAQITLADERNERERQRLVKCLCISIVSGILAVLLTVFGFLLYLNQYEFSNVDYSQCLESVSGDAIVEDGITVIDNSDE